MGLLMADKKDRSKVSTLMKFLARKDEDNSKTFLSSTGFYSAAPYKPV